MFKKSKKPYFGAILPKFGQKWFFLEKKALSIFRSSNYLTLCYESEKNYQAISEKNDKLMDGWTDRQTDQWTDNGDFIEPTEGQGFNNIITKLIIMMS